MQLFEQIYTSRHAIFKCYCHFLLNDRKLLCIFNFLFSILHWIVLGMFLGCIFMNLQFLGTDESNMLPFLISSPLFDVMENNQQSHRERKRGQILTRLRSLLSQVVFPNSVEFFLFDLHLAILAVEWLQFSVVVFIGWCLMIYS